MGFMDKFKNLFTDEEIIEEDINDPIEIKEIKKEEPTHKLPTFMRERLESENQKETFKYNIDKEEKTNFEEPNELTLKENEILNNQKKVDEFSNIEEKSSFKFPLEFSDDDFIETRSRHKTHTQNLEKEKSMRPVNEIKERPEKLKTIKKDPTKVSELYKEKKQEVKKFKATPIISPIYGVLNKNYNSDEVACNKGENLEEKRHSKSVDFDSVRKKAYGNLSKEIKENLMCENCEYLKEAKECQRLKEQEVEDNMVYEALNEQQYEEARYNEEKYENLTELDEEYDYYSNITLDEATENYYDHGVEYEKTLKTSRVPEEIVINNHEDEEKYQKKGIPPVKSSINLLSTLKKSMGDEEDEKNLELTDDLFNLIDSMYDERND